MPGSVSPRRHGVSRVLFGGDVAPAGSPTKPQSPRALTASLQSTYSPLPHSLSELKRMPDRGGGIASSRSLNGSMQGGADAAISAARVVSRGVSPASGRRRTAVGRCNVPSYVVAALAEGASEVVFASSSLHDSNRRQPPKFNSSTAPLSDRDMGGCTLPQSSLIVDMRKGSPLRGSISPRRYPDHLGGSSSSPRSHNNRTLNSSSSMSSPRGVAARSGAVGGVEEALPVIGTGTHKIPFFPDASHFKSSKRGANRGCFRQQENDITTTASPSRAMDTGDHPPNDSRCGVSHVAGSPGRLIGSVPPQCPSPTLPRAITNVPTRSGTNPIYPLEVTKHLVQADSNSALYVSESARMFKPSLVGYTTEEAETRDASIRRKWANGDRRATVEAGLLHRKQQEVTTKELNEQRRIEMKRYQKEYYEDRLLEYQKWEAKKLRLGHK